MSTTQSTAEHPSILYLIGTREWDTLRDLLQDGAYNDTVNNNVEMSTIIAFAVSFQAPPQFLHFLCNLNPGALTVRDLPFQLARRSGTNVQTVIVLEAARQKAVVESFNNSSSSLVSVSEIVSRATRFMYGNTGF